MDANKSTDSMLLVFKKPNFSKKDKDDFNKHYQNTENNLLKYMKIYETEKNKPNYN